MPQADEETLLRQATQAARRLAADLQRDAADLSAAGNIPNKSRGQSALSAADAAARRLFDELEKIP